MGLGDPKFTPIPETKSSFLNDYIGCENACIEEYRIGLH
jgi:hypothetical protein